MPTYDYRCNACGHEFELFQQMSDSLKRKCPECGKQQLERLIGTGAGVIFKGGGFYETDYRSESYRKGADAEKPKPEGKDSSSKSDAGAKPESSAAKSDAAAKPAPASNDTAKSTGDSSGGSTASKKRRGGKR